MAIKLKSLRYIIWPKNISAQQTGVFALIGGAIGLAGDLAGFFTSILNPNLLAGLFLLAAAVFAFFCLQKVFGQKPVTEEAVAERAHCKACDTLRFSLFAVITFGVLMLIGQGQTATETVGERLGLIEKGVGEIGHEVSGLGDITRSQKIRANPKTAEDYFANAWIYTNIHRDQSKAHAALEEMYAKFAPKKLDAAELYFATGRETKGRNDLIKQAELLGERQKDATLLVVAGRNAPDEAEAQRLYEKARQIDPELPFGWWDVQRLTQTAAGTRVDAASQTAMLRRQVEGLEVFIEKIGNKPAGAYFFLPQYQPDHEQLARQTLTSYRTTLETYERLGR